MNLLRDPWLLTRAEDASVKLAPVFDVLGDRAKPWHPRASLNSAQYEFLVSIVQATMTPADIDEWEDLYRTPPSTDAIQAKLNRLAPAFELFGDGPRFMQDIHTAAKDEKPAHGLLFGYPGEQTISQNKDLFIKRDEAPWLAPETAAIGLFALQIWASSGGRGYNTSPRGGGPITALVMDDTVWKTVWRNILTADELEPLGWERDPECSDFPWMTGLPATGDLDIRPGNVHPVCLYFPQPRRVWMNTVTDDGAPCPVSGHGSASGLRVSAIRTAQGGCNYSGKGWRHPLTTFIETPGKPEAANHLHGGAALDFRDWLGLAIEKRVRDKPSKMNPDGKLTAIWYPPMNVAANRMSRSGIVGGSTRPSRGFGGSTRLWCFGFNTSNATMVNWVEATMPVILDVPMVDFDTEIARLIGATQDVRMTLRVALMRGKTPLAESFALAVAEETFIGTLAPVFDQIVAKIATILTHDPASDPASAPMSDRLEQCRRDWLAALRKAALTAFDDTASVGSDIDKAFQKAENRQFLRNTTGSSKLRDILVLAREEARQATAKENAHA